MAGLLLKNLQITAKLGFSQELSSQVTSSFLCLWIYPHPVLQFLGEDRIRSCIRQLRNDRYIDSKCSYKEIIANDCIKKIYFRIFGCREIRSSSVRIIQFTKCSSILWYLLRCSFRLCNGISNLQTPQIIQVLSRGYLRFYLKKLILK